MSGRVVVFLAAMSVLSGAVTACGSSDRPRELPLDDVQPCDLISQAELRDLQVKAPPEPIPVVAGAGQEGTSCQYSPLYGGSVTIGIITNHGIDRWTDGSMESFRATDLPKVQGYRTIRVEVREVPSGPHDGCTSYVDVASGQSLKVDVGANSADDPPTCEMGRRFAGVAIQALAG